MTHPPRKGARRVAEIPPETLAAINRGEIDTVNLVEYVAVDVTQLLPAAATRIALDPAHPEILATLACLPALKPMQRHWAAAGALHRAIADDAARRQALASQRSDILRQWAAMFNGLDEGKTLTQRLAGARPFAADPHFGVREIAWLAVRNAVVANIEQALELLLPWTHEADANLRRFASELTRPRGVWCAHIEPLKQNPTPGQPLLQGLRADPSRYVQDSVANWLNDAAKTRPDWTKYVCRDWLDGNTSKATAYICRRGLRSVPESDGFQG